MLILCSVLKVHSFKIVGVFNGEGPPVPIPNTEVKLTSADNTCLETDREDRSMPTQKTATIVAVFFYAPKGAFIIRFYASACRFCRCSTVYSVLKLSQPINQSVRRLECREAFLFVAAGAASYSFLCFILSFLLVLDLTVLARVQPVHLPIGTHNIGRKRSRYRKINCRDCTTG